jgi:hypothetical protein
MHAFEHFCHISLHIKIIDAIETQKQQGLTVFEEALYNIALFCIHKVVMQRHG